jgi:hypothetical protein
MNQLPLWFLAGSLFLPRVSLLVGYFLHDLRAFSLSGFIPPVLAVVFPRALILILIFQDRGWSGWLLVHAIALWMAYVGTGAAKKRTQSRAV